MEYPMPEIYIWEQPPNPDTGSQKFSIVDGQQRLSTIKQFLSNEWPLKKKYLNDEHTESDFADCSWKDLSQAQKQAIFSYFINIRRIPQNVGEDEIRLIFARLNETDRSLNPQEMRHATLNGEFLQASAQLADDPLMTGLNIFSHNDIRRMLDIEFCSQLLGFERRGIVSDTPKELNDLYDTYNNEYPEKINDINNVKRSILCLSTIFSRCPIVKEKFERQIYVYTFHSLFSSASNFSAEYWGDKLAAFAEAYDARAADPNVAKFREGASSRTRSRGSRMDRLNSLRNWIADNSGQ